MELEPVPPELRGLSVMETRLISQVGLLGVEMHTAVALPKNGYAYSLYG